MNVLFVHQGFPGQFVHLAPELYRRGHNVQAIGTKPDLEHDALSEFERRVARGVATYWAARELRDNGFTPDVMIAHPGWGEALFLKEVWPRTKLVLFAECYYSGRDFNFDPEFLAPEEALCNVRVKNAHLLLSLAAADAAWTPTQWQHSTFPEEFQEKIAILPDGVDTQRFMPDPLAKPAVIADKPPMGAEDEIITFVARDLEPYKGYHVFMRALPAILEARPKAQVLIVGGDGTSYGAPPPEGRTWREIYQAEVWNVDRARVHFLGRVPQSVVRTVLQVSTAHVYLTYPIPLSWSVQEAASCGCAIVANDVGPVRDMFVNGASIELVDFEAAALAHTVSSVAGDPDWRALLASSARKSVTDMRVTREDQIQFILDIAAAS